MQKKVAQNLEDISNLILGINQNASLGLYSEGSNENLISIVSSAVSMQALLMEAMEVNEASYSKELIGLSTSMICGLSEVLVSAHG
ncbi:hypothetical protein [Photobacterium kishitanii]|uniref:hypothetical protein n=1 Tax=Photobacterium kishitanii TaxID=318456 RepID=UPI0011B23C3E|nr:hypothetical protein [Photobacterium kishitanii]